MLLDVRVHAVGIVCGTSRGNVGDAFAVALNGTHGVV